MKYGVGIDLGTTNSACCTLKNGKFEMIKLSRRNDILPSVLIYSEDGGIKVGDDAKKRASINPDNYIKSSKTFMGDDNKIWNIEDEIFSPTIVAAELLKSINKSAKKFFKTEEAISAVITVPAYFTSKQRAETKKAGELAGFKVDGIITEPVAAALAYGYEEDKDQTLLVVDLGGGTFDVTILNIDNNNYNTLAIEGDSKLGGDNFDQVILNIFLKNIRTEFGIDLSTFENSDLDKLTYSKALHTLSEKAEDAKILLSQSEYVEVSIPNFIPGKSLECTITREDFKSDSYTLLSKIRRTINNTLINADLDEDDIDKVILVGGSSNIPFIREIVREIFDKEAYSDMDLSKIVAMGAALRANIEESGFSSPRDITAHSLGIKIVGNKFSVIIPKNTSYPTSKTETYTTTVDYQEVIDISVYEGEDELATNNKFYGGFKLSDIQHALQGVPKIDVTFEFDKDQILHVKAKDRITGTSGMKVIKL